MKVLDSLVSKRIAVAYLLLGAVPVEASDCLGDVRAVGNSIDGAQATRMRLYQCGAAGRNLVQLEFHRLNDLAMGLMLKTGLPSNLGLKLNGIPVVQNRVLEEYQRLISKFGVGESYSQGDFGVRSAAQADGGAFEQVSIDQSIKVIVAGQGDEPTVDFPDPDALASIRQHTDVPPGYTSVPGGGGSYFHIWRFMLRDELTNYPARVRAFNQLVSNPRFGKRMFRDRVPREIELNRYLAQQGLPQDFLFIRGYRNEVGCGEMVYWEFKYYPRRLLVNLVTIENISSSPQSIDGLTGELTDQPVLRTAPGSTGLASLPSSNMTGSLGVLPPGGRLIVPLSLVWAPADGIAALWEADAGGRPPRMQSYVWGPQLNVGGIVVGGRRLQLEGRAANFLHVTTSCACGSCPYLYAWDEGVGDWVNSGVMLEWANSPTKAMWDWRKFEGAVLRFQVREEEAETTLIEGAGLDIELLDGRRIQLQPLNDAATASVELMFNDCMEYSFALPSGVKATEVSSSTFRLLGHYQRYTDLLATTA